MTDADRPWLAWENHPSTPKRGATGKSHAWRKGRTTRDVATCKVCGVERFSDVGKRSFGGAPEVTTTYRTLPPYGDGRWTTKRPGCVVREQEELFSGARVEAPTIPPPHRNGAIQVVHVVNERPAREPFTPPPAARTYEVTGVICDGVSVVWTLDADGEVFGAEWAWDVFVTVAPTSPAEKLASIGGPQAFPMPRWSGECGIGRVERMAERMRRTAPNVAGVLVVAKRSGDGYLRWWRNLGAGRPWTMNERGTLHAER